MFAAAEEKSKSGSGQPEGCHWRLAISRGADALRSEEHTSELQSPCNLVCRLLLEKKKKQLYFRYTSAVRPGVIYVASRTTAKPLRVVPTTMTLITPNTTPNLHTASDSATTVLAV